VQKLGERVSDEVRVVRIKESFLSPFTIPNRSLTSREITPPASPEIRSSKLSTFT
jgi:hypothetical protein